MKIVDSHAHLNSTLFDDDLVDVLARARSVGVTRIVVPAISWKSIPQICDLALTHAEIFAAVGIYPKACGDWQSSDIERLRSYANQPKVVAIGEIGLDYNWRKKPPADAQRIAFRDQLTLAAEVDLPVIIHNWQAEDDILRTVAASPLAGHERAGVMHGISANSDFAHRALDLGFYLGIGGPITYPNAKKLPALVAKLPLERLLIETDAPNMPPHPHRGNRNEPAYVRLIGESLAEACGKNVAEIAKITTENAERLFNLA